MKSDSPYIAQMLECIAKIKRYVGVMTFEEFKNKEMAQSAVLMQLHEIGEMAKRVSEETKSTTDIPWAQIAGMRNRISHEYDEVDLENVWKIISLDLAKTESSLAAYLAQHPIPEDKS